MEVAATTTTTTLGLEYNILKDRLTERFEKGNKLAGKALQDLYDQGQLLNDHLVPVHGLSYANTDTGVQMLFSNKEGVTAGDMHDNAVSQLATKLGLPPGFIKDLVKGQGWQRDLAVSALEGYTEHTEAANLLVRKVGDQVRAVLSDRYRRMNNLPVFTNFIRSAQAQGAKLYDGHVGELRAFVEVMMPDIFAVDTPNNGRVWAAMGAQISSSDFGQGSFEVRTYLLQVKCLNGMVGNSVVREIHLGKRLGEADFAFSENTYAKDTETMASAVADIAKTIFGPAYRQKLIDQVVKASEEETTMEQQAKSLPKLGVQKTELEAIQEILANSDPEDGVQGKMTTWKVTQAITAHARNAEPKRMRELQEIAGQMLGVYA